MAWPDLSAWGKAAGAQLGAVLDELLCVMRDGARHGRDSALAAEGMARTAAYQFGIPPESGIYPPRSMTELPYTLDYDLEDAEGGRIQLDMILERNRPVQAGYIANVGESLLMVSWYGVARQAGGMIRLPVGASLQVPCILRGVICEPAEGEQGGILQVSFL